MPSAANNPLSSNDALWANKALQLEKDALRLLQKNPSGFITALSQLPIQYQCENATLLWLGLSHAPNFSEQAVDYFQARFDECLTQKKIDKAFYYWALFSRVKLSSLNVFTDIAASIKTIQQLIDKEGLPKQQQIRVAFIATFLLAQLYVDPIKKRLLYWEDKLQFELLITDDPLIKASLYNHLILFHTWMGNMLQVRLLQKESIGISYISTTHPMNILAQKSSFAKAYCLNLEHEKALEMIQAGLDFSEKTQVTLWRTELKTLEVYTQLCSQNLTAAQTALTKIEHEISRENVLEHAQQAYLHSWLYLELNDLDQAEHYALQALELTRRAGTPYPRIVFKICLAHIYIAQNKFKKATQMLLIIQATNRQIGSQYIRVGSIIAQAYLHLKRQTPKYWLCLKKAMQLLKRERYNVIPGCSHQVFSTLLEDAFFNSIEKETAKKLIGLHIYPPSERYPVVADWPWPISIKLWGHFSLRRQQHDLLTLEKPQYKVYELIQLLALYPKSLDKHQLIHYLWQDSLEEKKAIQVFNTNLFRARKLLGRKNAIQLKKGHLSLNKAYCYCDIFTLHSLLDCRVSNDSAINDKQIHKLKQFLKNDHLLTSEQDTPWLIEARSKLNSDIKRFIALRKT